MFETRQAAAGSQQEFWIETRRLPQATASTFYRKLEETLDSIGFAAGVREICLPAYADSSRGGHLAATGGIVMRAHSSAWTTIALLVTAWTRKFSQSQCIRHHIDPLRVSVRNVLSDSGTRRFSTGC